jgi:phosphatidylserine/phosphatidylglycerophosphate/cardiolipin synthase-like enzyme
MTPDDLESIVEIGSTLPVADVDKLVVAATAGVHMVRMLRADSAGGLYRACSLILRIATATPLMEISGALQGASRVSRHHHGRIDLVWTGPDVPGSVSRLTSSVVADLVDQATSEIVLVSYAMQSERNLASALGRAVRRGVSVQLLYERTEDNPNFKTWTHRPFQEIHVRRLAWPSANRSTSASMHAKALIVDRQISLIGSANITDTAMLNNIELGVIVRDRAVASEIVESLESLIARGVLREVD